MILMTTIMKGNLLFLTYSVPCAMLAVATFIIRKKNFIFPVLKTEMLLFSEFSLDCYAEYSYCR
jgi:hypothetical protein